VTRQGTGSRVEGAEVVFCLPDTEHRRSGVRLWQQLGLPAEQVQFEQTHGGWELRIARPAVHRVEYLFEVCDMAGEQTTIMDPTNASTVAGVFGTHSVLTLPEYVAPTWLEAEPVAARLDDVVVESAAGDIAVQVWSPAGAVPDAALPLLMAHDGPELAAYAGLLHYVGVMIGAGTLPRLRLAMLSPGDDRSSRYAADEAYAGALADTVVTTVTGSYPTAGRPVLAGVSLGALAALHAQWRHPGVFAGLFLQSGSFFTADTDPQEQEFVHFGPVTAFVATVLRSESWPTSVDGSPAVAMTCGYGEENVHNNRVMAARLRELGLAVQYAESPDGHNFTAWRDVLHPHLTGLLRRVWGARACSVNRSS